MAATLTIRGIGHSIVAITQLCRCGQVWRSCLARHANLEAMLIDALPEQRTMSLWTDCSPAIASVVDVVRHPGAGSGNRLRTARALGPVWHPMATASRC